MILENNVIASIISNVAPSDEIIQIEQGKENLFKVGMLLTLVQFQHNVVFQREIVKITNINGNIIGVQRAFEPCPLNDNDTQESQISLEFNSGDICVNNLTAGDLKNIEQEIQNLQNNKLNSNDITITKQGNDFNGPEQLLKLNDDGSLPELDGSNLTNLSVDTKVETTYIKDMELGEELNGIFLVRKGEKIGEDPSKIYKSTTGDGILGLYKGNHSATQNIANFGGKEFEISQQIMIAGILKNTGNILKKISLKIAGRDTDEFQLQICEVVGGVVDFATPIYEETFVDKSIKTIKPVNGSVGYGYNSWTGGIMRRHIINTPGIYEIKGDFSANGYGRGLHCIKVNGTIKADFNGGAQTLNTGKINLNIGDDVTFESYKVSSSDGASVINIEIIPSPKLVDLPIPDIQINNKEIAIVLSKIAGTPTDFLCVDGTEGQGPNNLIKSTTFKSGMTTIIQGGIYLGVEYASSEAVAFSIIHKGIYEHSSDLYNNTDYYITSDGQLTTISDGNIKVGRSLSNRKILLDNFNFNTSTTATTGGVTLGNAEGFITININGEMKKIPYFGV